MWLAIAILVIVVAYLASELQKAKGSLKDLEESVDGLRDFEHSLVGVAGQDHKTCLSNIEAFLKLKNRHQHENLFKLIFDKEKYDKVDWDALDNRQKQEMGELYSQLVKKTGSLEDISFPVKEA